MILEDIVNEDINIIFKNRVFPDYEAGSFLQELVNNKNFFEKKFSQKSSNFTIDEFFKYLIVRNVKKMMDVHENIIKEGDKEFFSLIYDYYISKGEVIKFINENISDIFTLQYDYMMIKQSTMDCITEFISGINDDVFKFISTNYEYLMMNKEVFDSLFKNKNKFNNSYEIIFNNYLKELRDNNNYVYTHQNEEILSLCAYSIKKNTPDEIKELSNEIIESEFDLVNKVKENQLMLHQNIVFFKILRDTLYEINDDRYKKIDNICLEVNEKIELDIKKNGIKIEQEVSEDIVTSFWNENYNPMQKLIYLTHTDIYSPRITPDYVINPIDDVISTGEEVNEYFTFSRQQSLDTLFDFFANFIFLLISEKKRRDELLTFVDIALEKISKFLDDEEIHLNGLMLIQNFVILTENEESIKKDKNVKNALFYNLGSISCFMSDKLLKTMYLKSHKEKQNRIDEAHITLGICLSKEEETKYFSYDHMQSLKYFLLNNGAYKGIGYNLRNDFAHLNNINEKTLTINKVYGSFFIFLDILNTILIKSFQEK
ncbi:hypothetical protein AKUH4B410M_10880 [Apilactobacillus kunkeei]|uniref:hypothetical protein n=1 Tax=Apilactobacillus kunkeei TaxID=148814 RepID=UPI00200A17C6|nr:hypothetical protein [Apilactobacillus kunkeei]MCK8628384.1 hypothetical protein [Apilactobacillus kunkeei]CAI2629374.1 hypothetical protein AKUH4B405J_10890 [Apilactobacillus kunkeei]CAI2631487.1 hypothetical protein AKUH4B410M_10880 [Apilactobacillus kunkeei]CAI2632494.1 hypothetical protein AKUH4B102A_11160 [Apilactobacillus kunkeei]CAI2687719.1 hypothetical protein AKUH3B102X_10880 [Apilactobacillus kunkeei]